MNLGNIPEARDAQSPDINWIPSLAIQTRAQAKQTEQSKSQLRNTSILDSDRTPGEIRTSQVSDPTSVRIRTACEEQVIKGNS